MCVTSRSSLDSYLNIQKINNRRFGLVDDICCVSLFPQRRFVYEIFSVLAKYLLCFLYHRTVGILTISSLSLYLFETFHPCSFAGESLFTLHIFEEHSNYYIQSTYLKSPSSQFLICLIYTEPFKTSFELCSISEYRLTTI